MATPSRGSGVLVVLPAYNAARTLADTVVAMPPAYEGTLLLVDDASADDTCRLSAELGLTTVRHERNRGYGGSQKTGYAAALERGAGIVVMLHPDGQYEPRMIEALVRPIELGICDIVLGNRVRSRRETLAGGMPVSKYLVNRLLTGLENLVLGQNLGDFHSGMRAYSARALRSLPIETFTDDFGFDSQLLIAAAYQGLRIGDVPVPTVYTPESSQIGWRKGVRYTVATLVGMSRYLVQRAGLARFRTLTPIRSGIEKHDDALVLSLAAKGSVPQPKPDR